MNRDPRRVLIQGECEWTNYGLPHHRGTAPALDGAAAPCDVSDHDRSTYGHRGVYPYMIRTLLP